MQNFYDDHAIVQTFKNTSRIVSAKLYRAFEIVSTPVRIVHLRFMNSIDNVNVEKMTTNVAKIVENHQFSLFFAKITTSPKTMPKTTDNVNIRMHR